MSRRKPPAPPRSAGGAGLRCWLGAGAVLLAAAVPWPGQLRAETASPQPAIEELIRRIEERDRDLAERDAVIVDLLRRVEALERRLAAGAQGGAQDPAWPGPESVAPAAAGAPPAQSAQAEAAGSGPPAAPGALEVDEAAAERALERSLTQAGALLLEYGRAEVEPGLTYVRRDQDGPLLLTDGGGTVVTATRLRSNELEAAVDIRIGLPWDAQFEVGLPYRYLDRSTVAQSAASGSSSLSEASVDAMGFGDVRVGLAKTLLRERGWRPDLIARVEWDADTGQEDDGIPLGSGFDELTGSLTALKRQDPLAFVGRVGYRSVFENGGVDPGDEIFFSLGAILAASPDTSLSATLEQAFAGEVEVGGQGIPGSDQVESVFVLGVSSILGPGVLLSLQGGIGLTEDAPDYFVTLSVPVRFDLPWR